MQARHASFGGGGRTETSEYCRRNLADILSVLAMTASEEGSRESLRFRLEGGGESVGVWGHEYVRCDGGDQRSWG